MAEIFIHDEFGPEANAMLQALYSRSPESVERHVAKVREKGSAKFMESYYVGYGHASIGDCGVTTLFIEGVSILACKAIQDNPLYSGQETSTRYIDFSSQAIHDPIDTSESRAILENWRNFYIEALQPLEAFLKSKFPLRQGEQEKIWEKAIQARGFDILRGFLPAGITSQLSWTTNLRQAYDKIVLLQHHPLAEVRQLAENMLAMLKVRYPSSFGHRPNEQRDSYLERFNAAIHYLGEKDDINRGLQFNYTSTLDNQELERDAADIIKDRPPWTNLPKFLSRYGQYSCEFLLDYGSFRDLQRHRAGLCQLPVLSAEYGFNPWYLDQLPDLLKDKAMELGRAQNRAIKALKDRHSVDASTLQYYFPLGYNVRCEIVYDLPEMVYVTELRSGSTVHSTLRKIAHSMHAALSREHPLLRLYTDLTADPWDIKRGTQDIVERKD